MKVISHDTILYYTLLYYAILYYTILYYTILYMYIYIYIYRHHHVVLTTGSLQLERMDEVPRTVLLPIPLLTLSVSEGWTRA